VQFDRLEGGKLMKILLATDGSPCSEAAVNEVARRPWPTGSEVRIISAVELPTPPASEPWALPPDYFQDIEKAAREQAQAALNSAASKCREGESKLLVTIELLEGSPKHVILDEAEQWEADLIVIGSHGYRGLQRFLLGSVSQAVASHAKCSVEIVRCRQAG
jgi:nucleotide-binding universal stress UspA family protein